MPVGTSISYFLTKVAGAVLKTLKHHALILIDAVPLSQFGRHILYLNNQVAARIGQRIHLLVACKCGVYVAQ